MYEPRGTFLIFWLHGGACGILVLWPGIEPGPQPWKLPVLTLRLPGNFQEICILNSFHRWERCCCRTSSGSRAASGEPQAEQELRGAGWRWRKRREETAGVLGDCSESVGGGAGELFDLCSSGKRVSKKTGLGKQDWLSAGGGSFHPGSVGKESACNAGDLGSIPGLERSPGGGSGRPAPVFSPGESHG